MEIYGDNLYTTGISYPKEKFFIKDDSSDAIKILLRWKFKADIPNKKITFDSSSPEPTPEEQKKKIIEQSKKIISSAMTISDIKIGILKLIEAL